MSRSVLFVAGEASGDLHGAEVVRQLRCRDPNLEVLGVGGDLMKAAGMRLLYHIREISVVGITEVLKHLPVLRSVERTLKEVLRLKKPSAVCLIDYPGFNLRFARAVKSFGIPVVYYVSPQVWAWRRGRMKKIRQNVDKMLVILPFEEAMYRNEGVPVEYVGHPLTEEVQARLTRQQFCANAGIKPDRKILALFPGSRRNEVRKFFPVMVEAASRIARDERWATVVGLARGFTKDDCQTALGPEFTEGALMDFADSIHYVSDESYELMNNAAFGFVKSGTTTLEMAMFGTPMVVGYSTSEMSYQILKRLVRVKHISLVNIIAGKTVVPELIQHEFNPQKLADTAQRILDDPAQLERMRTQLLEVRKRLGEHKASHRVAESILAAIE